MSHNPGFLKVVEDARRQIQECTIEEVKTKIDRGHSFELIDVREDLEYAKDHARNAKHIGRGVLERDIETMIPDKQADIVLYCGGGYRSALAADMLGKMGYTNVWSMDGGWKAWKDSGAPVE